MFSGMVSLTCPHAEHVFDDGSQRDTFATVRPYRSAFSSSNRTNCPHPASWIARANRRLRTIPAMFKSSTWTAWFSRTRLRACLW